MRNALAAVLLLAILPAAHAQDKAKGDFTHDGEFRLRDTWDIDGTGQKSSNNWIDERIKLDLGFKVTDRLSVDTTLLNNITWGRGAGQTLNTPDGTGGNVGDFITVNQAYASWMMSDEFKLKFGRMNYQIADGSLIGHNDWERVPYAFEGVLGNYEMEFGKFQLFAFKFRELGNNYNTTTVTAPDAERNAYGLNFDLKTMPEVVKSVNVHIIQDTSDAVVGDGTTGVNSLAAGNPGRSITRYGLNAGFAFAMLDFKAWYEGLTGKYHVLDATDTKTDFSAAASMMQFELGANFTNFMNSRVFIKYHMDTGNKENSDTNGKVTTYDAYFHDQHGSAGMMDFFDWGNLTFIEIGANAKPMDNTEVGLAYWMFSKTEHGTSATATNPASNPTAGPDGNLGSGDFTKSKLGNELDVWAEHTYGAGFSTVARVSYFMPGDVYTSSANTIVQNQKPIQVFVQGRLTF